MAGEVEGIVGSLGLFYTTLISGGDRAMIPNNVMMQLAVIPIAEPERVDMKAKFDVSVTPAKLQRMLEKSVTIPLRTPPVVTLEELEGDEITVNIIAVPLNPADGPKLASDVLEAVKDTDLDGRPDQLGIVTDEHPTQGAAPRTATAARPASRTAPAKWSTRRRPASRSGAAQARGHNGPARDRGRDQRQVERGGPVGDAVPRQPGGQEGDAVARVDGGADRRGLGEASAVVARREAVEAEGDVAPAGEPGQRDRGRVGRPRSRGPRARGR